MPGRDPQQLDWERSATKWLRDLVPSTTRTTRCSGSTPCCRRRRMSECGARSGSPGPPCRPARAELPALGLHESVIEHTIKMYAAEVLQLNHIAQGASER